MTETVTARPTIEINQDYEYDEDFGLGSQIETYWAEGHGHDAGSFIRAVVDYSLDEHDTSPRITHDSIPEEVWQYAAPRNESVQYIRASSPMPEGARRGDYKPITVLDLDRRGRGATKCSVRDCAKPWSVGRPVRVVVETTDGGATVNDPYMAVEMWLCREHSRKMPQPSYRVFFVPVGATIELPAADATTGGAS